MFPGQMNPKTDGSQDRWVPNKWVPGQMGSEQMGLGQMILQKLYSYLNMFSRQQYSVMVV